MTCFSVDATSVPMEVDLPGGGKAMATVGGKRVQLTSATHGTWALNLTGDEAKAWTAQAGEPVTITIGG